MGERPVRVTVLIGTYTEGGVGAEGIYSCTLNTRTGALSGPVLVARAANPSFLTLHPSGRFLYAVNELEQHAGAAGGAVTAYEIGARAAEGEYRDARHPAPASQPSLNLRHLNQQPTHGVAPCHLSVDPTGRYLLVANYGGGVTLLPILPSGELGAATQVVEHEGSGPNLDRQGSSHPHSVRFGPAGEFVFVSDLGIDRLMAYSLNAETGRLAACRTGGARLAAGAGPRHLAFHPTGSYAYVANELSSTITAFRHHRSTGKVDELHSVPTVPDPAQAENYPAEVQVHPAGVCLYVSNRGHDSIGVFAIDPATGYVQPVGHEPTGGRFPRHFTLDPSGRWLLVANQHSGTVTAFQVKQDGSLVATRQKMMVPTPVCLLPLNAQARRAQP